MCLKNVSKKPGVLVTKNKKSNFQHFYTFCGHFLHKKVCVSADAGLILCKNQTHINSPPQNYSQKKSWGISQ